MKENVPYKQWPEFVKIATAINIKGLTVKDPKAIRGLSYVNIGIGVVLLVLEALVFPDNSSDKTIIGIETSMFAIAVFNILIGLYNYFITAKAINWILENSTWEERHTNTPERKHLIISWTIILFIVLVLVGCIWLLFQ